MSEKLQIKGNVIVSEPDVKNWFEFENLVLKSMNNNKYHAVNAVCEFKQYVGPEIMGSYKLKGNLCSWTNFAIQVVAMQDKYDGWSMSCTVTFKACKKGKLAEQAIRDSEDMFATTKMESPLEVYNKHKELIDGMYQAGKNSEDEESDEELEGVFLDKLKDNVDLGSGEVC